MGQRLVSSIEKPKHSSIMFWIEVFLLRPRRRFFRHTKKNSQHFARAALSLSMTVFAAFELGSTRGVSGIGGAAALAAAGFAAGFAAGLAAGAAFAAGAGLAGASFDFAASPLRSG